MRSTRPDHGRAPGPAGVTPAGPGAAGTGAARPAARPGGARVLIVEDEPALLRALRIDLRARGYEVLTAATGQDALAQAAAQPPDAVLLDLGLPDGDGTTVIARLRTWSRVPVIV